jgi:hypothetical protein
MNGPSNGKNGSNNRIAAWALGLLLPPFLGMAVGWAATSNLRGANHAERIAVIEAQLKDTRDELHAINIKLDKLLDQQRRP